MVTWTKSLNMTLFVLLDFFWNDLKGCDKRFWELHAPHKMHAMQAWRKASEQLLFIPF